MDELLSNESKNNPDEEISTTSGAVYPYKACGESKHSLDEKNRVSVPSRYRQWPSNKEDCEFVIVRVKQNYLAAFPYPDWDIIVEKLMSLSQLIEKNRSFVRAFSRRSTRIKCDKQGRLLLPQDCLQHAKITSEIVIIGVGRGFELWSPDVLKDRDENPEEFDEDFKNKVGDIF